MSNTVDGDAPCLPMEHASAGPGPVTESSTLAGDGDSVHELGRMPLLCPAMVHHGVADQDLEAQAEAGEKEKASRISAQGQPAKNIPSAVLPLMDLNSNVVGWDCQDDPSMPLNFSAGRKWVMVFLLSAVTFMTPWASSILAPGLDDIQREFAITNETLGALPVSIFLLGYAVGPLFLSPLSEIYGRNIVMLSANLFFCLWLIGCALAPTLNTLIVFRFLCGLGGSACQTVGGAIIADMFSVSERGKATTMWMLGPILGPSLAPVVGGFVAETIGWRWCSWISFIPGILVIIAMFFFNKETNHYVLMRIKRDKLRKALGRPELCSCYTDPEKPSLSKKQILLQGLTRPIRMISQSMILFGISLYIAFNYGCLYLLFNTIPTVFQGSYGWSLGISGLPYLSLLIGYMSAITFLAMVLDKSVIRLTMANSGIYEPEMRLSHAVYFACLIPISFFWYGWAAEKQVHWIVPLIGIIPFSAGIIGVWTPANMYLIDAFPEYSASALAGFAVVRCTVGTFLPLAAPAMYRSLGLGWGNSLLGFIALAFVPIPWVINRYGRGMRQRWPLSF